MSDIRLGLVVVVVGDEVVDGVLGEELPVFLCKLCGKRLVMRKHQCCLLHAIYHVRYSKRLSRARDS